MTTVPGGGFTAEDVLVAHNAPFDLRFLNYERLRLRDGYFTQPWLDTLVLARRLLNGVVPRHDLRTLARWAGASVRPSHRALADAVLAGARTASCTTSLDLSSFEVVNASRDWLFNQFRHGIDVVFANAGISGGPGFLTLEGARNAGAAAENVSPEIWERVLRTNLADAQPLAQRVLRQSDPAKTRELLEPLLEIGGDARPVTSREGTGTEVVLDRQLRERSSALWHLRHAGTHDGLGRRLLDRGTTEFDDARASDGAADGTHGRGLARPVGAEHHDDLTLVHLEVESVQHRDGSVPGHEARCAQQCHDASPPR